MAVAQAVGHRRLGRAAVAGPAGPGSDAGGFFSFSLCSGVSGGLISESAFARSTAKSASALPMASACLRMAASSNFSTRDASIKALRASRMLSASSRVFSRWACMISCQEARCSSVRTRPICMPHPAPSGGGPPPARNSRDGDGRCAGALDAAGCAVAMNTPPRALASNATAIPVELLLSFLISVSPFLVLVGCFRFTNLLWSNHG